MKKYGIVKICLAICLVAGMILVPANLMEADAEEVIATVEGTVLSETTHELLQLSTKEGKMEIKLDSKTDTGGCKMLLTGEKISVSVSHGFDGYLHAVKINSITDAKRVSLDSATTAVVTGTVDAKSNGDILYFDTTYGEMELKLDTTTDMSGCKILVAGKTYEITCARGSDAYMHATKITDAATSVGTSVTTTISTLTPAPASAIDSDVKTMSVSGTVSSKTKENLLYLSTAEGEMQFVIDSKTDSRNGMVLTEGTKLTVTFYHGSDAYLHAAVLEGTKKNTLKTKLDKYSEAEVSGTVRSKSNENILYLDTIHGEMELKLDAVEDVNGCKVLVAGKKLSVTCVRGDDAYMHAVDITGV